MGKDLMQLISDESFQRWLMGNASQSESQRWEQWKEASTQNQSSYVEAKRLWKAGTFNSIAHSDVENEWQRLVNRIHLADQRNNIHSFKPVLSLTGRNNRRWSWRYVGVAVVASVVLAISYVFIQNQVTSGIQPANVYQYVSTEYGQRATITLSDGTSIVLNANSTLGYPSEWNKETARTVMLRGEAYFHVTKKPEGHHQDFIVKTSEGDVKVLGTKFVVHERGSGTRVVLEEGSVEISMINESLEAASQEIRTLLKPGQLISFDKQSETLTPTEVDIAPYVTWWQTDFILNKTPLRDVIQRIEETYGVEVVVSDSSLLQRTLSGSIENQNLAVLTDALALALKISVRREDKVVIFK